jgi:hypothetical protein
VAANPFIERTSQSRLRPLPAAAHVKQRLGFFMHMFRVQIYPHNSFESLAQYHVGTVREKLATANYDCIGLDGISAVVAMAFAVEAILNFVGAKRVPGWKERAPFRSKVTALAVRLNFKFDASVEPFKTLLVLKQARDTMAHGQPVEFEVEVQSDREIGRSMQPTWSSEIKPEFVLAAYDQVNEFKRFLFAKARIKPSASYTSASSVGPKT